MGFWGIEVKPGKPHPYHSDNVQGTLYLTQATLGLGLAKERTILQCTVGHKDPVFLCSLIPNVMETCSLNLEFKDELVAFSVIGPQSIHITGYFVSDEGDHLRDEYDSDSGEDIAETETDESSEYDYDDEEYDDDFIDDADDLEMFPPSPVPNSGVVIEEIVEDDKPTNGNGKPKQLKKKKKKKNQSSDVEDQNKQIVVKGGSGVSVLESEDEDGFPISSSEKTEAARVQEPEAESDGQDSKRTTEGNKKNKARDGSDNDTGKKRKVKSTDQDGQLERKKKKQQREKGEDVNAKEVDDEKASPNENENENENEDGQRGLDIEDKSVHSEGSDKKKKKKKKKKTQDVGEDKNKDGTASAVGDELEMEEKHSTGKSLQVRTFPNGLVIEELAMGKPAGKKASPGSQVSVHYIGKLQKNGKIFDSNVGRAPFKFRLGVGQVIKGWDVGVNGMHIGDKRRITIPPSMGYGAKGAGKTIPPNSWLVFDVELVNVR